MSVVSEGHVVGVHRAERQAIAEAVLADPPPLPPVAEGVVRDIGGEVLHASRSRPVVRWVVTERSAGQSTTHAIVGKVYGKGDGAAVHALLQRLRDCGFDGAYSVPATFGFLPNRRLLLQSEAPSGTLHDGLADPVGTVNNVRRAGEWLARFHAVTGTDLRPLPVAFEAEKIDHYVSQLAVLHPLLALRLRHLQHELVPLLAAGGAGPLVPTHGDFQPKNVHMDGERIMVIDFDRAALAPAGRDLGHFVGQAITMAAASRKSFDDESHAWAMSLVDGYLAAGGSPDAVAAAPAYVARTFLEVLFYRLVVRPVADASFAAPWLDTCAGWLDRGSLEAR